MPVRGQRNIYPDAGGKPTGMFSSRGKQKMDPTDQFPHKGTMAYAKGSSTRSKPSGNGNQGLRHLKPKGK